MKDCIGQELHEGDIVAYNPPGEYKRLKVGKVYGFTPKGVNIVTVEQVVDDIIVNGYGIYPTNRPNSIVVKLHPDTYDFDGEVKRLVERRKAGLR